MDTIEQKVLDWIQSNSLFEDARRTLLAVSGGVDSVAMAAVLCHLRQAGRLHLDFVIGHVNHCLRGEQSDGDEAFVSALGQTLGVQTLSRQVEVRNHAARYRVSIETAGRNLRMRVLTEIAQNAGCDMIATAHHLDDQVETVMHRLMRGTSLKGLCGIRPAARLLGMRFVRPMLSLRRTEIEAYCRKNNLAWREDVSNRSLVFLRNRIRHQLLPTLQTQWPDVTERCTRLADLSRAAQERIESAANHLKTEIGKQQKDSVVLDRNAFVRQSPWLQVELASWAMQTLGCGLRDVTRGHYRRLMTVAANGDATKMMWPGGITVQFKQDKIVFSKVNDLRTCLPTGPMRLEIGKPVQFGPYKIYSELLERQEELARQILVNTAPFSERLDADRIQGNMVLRRPMPGDRFYPLGLGREKKVARFLLDSKRDKENRQNSFILADEQKIIWVGPVRLDDRVKITLGTRQILVINAEITEF